MDITNTIKFLVFCKKSFQIETNTNRVSSEFELEIQHFHGKTSHFSSIFYLDNYKCFSSILVKKAYKTQRKNLNNFSK